ncbi:MAG: BON domain-containing protein [Planctomycetales bacterium]
MISRNANAILPSSDEGHDYRLHEAHTLSELVAAAWRSIPQLMKRNLSYEMAEGTITLRGHVETYYQKQLVQESLRKVEGLRGIRNQIEVI